MLVSIILARILSPSDYGLIAITSIFIGLSEILIDGGFSTAIIRKNNVDEKDYGIALVSSLSLATVLYLVLFFLAPFISKYFNEPALIAVLRVISLTMFVQAFSVIRIGYINRNLQFKLLFQCNLISGIISGLMGILAALFGLGIWALVIQRLFQQLISTVLLFKKIEIKYKIRGSFSQLQDLLSFGFGVVGSSLLNYVGSYIYNLVIGKRFSATELGYYDKGAQLPMQFSLYTFGAMSSVLLPTLSSYQDDLAKVKHIVRKIVRMTGYLIFPLMIGMMVTAEDLIVLLLTSKWLPALRIMQYACIYYITTPFMLINVQVFFALGRSKLRIKTELIRLGLQVLSLLGLGLLAGSTINVLALANALIAVLIAVLSFYETRKLIDYSWKEIAGDLMKPALAGMLMGVLVFFLEWLLTPQLHSVPLIIFVLKVGGGILAYYVLSRILRIQELSEVKKLAERLLTKGENSEK